MKVLLEYVAALPPHHLSNPSYLSFASKSSDTPLSFAVLYALLL